MSSPGRSTDGLAPRRQMPFKRLMAFETLDRDTYRSITPAWPPGDGDTAFGGHVYAQAALAASKTVQRGMNLHNITGHFLLPGRVDTPFTYKVRRVRDGGSYALRQVSVYQHAAASTPLPPRFAKFKTLPDAGTPCFVATMSFKRSEKEGRFEKFSHQPVPASHVREEYKCVLGGKRPEDHPVAPSSDSMWWQRRLGNEARRLGESSPGLDVRKVDMSAYNGLVEEGGGGKVGGYRQLQFYRIVREEEDETGGGDEEEELNLHISAHLYASDRNSLYLIQHAHGYTERPVVMASLSHTVVFHGGAEKLRMVRGGWFVQEACTSNSAENRGCHETRLWNWEQGEIVGTTLQDGMVRIEQAEKVEEKEGGKEVEVELQGNVRRRRAQRVAMDVDGEIGGKEKAKL